jgi:hypothetical protein
MPRAHLALFLAMISSSAHAQNSDLTGLWKARRVFATDGKGPLVITKQSGSYSADFLGRQQVIALEHGELSFTLHSRIIEQVSFRVSVGRGHRGEVAKVAQDTLRSVRVKCGHLVLPSPLDSKPDNRDEMCFQELGV